MGLTGSYETLPIALAEVRKKCADSILVRVLYHLTTALLAGVIFEKCFLVFRGQIFGFTADQVQNSGRIETGSK